MIVRGWGHHSNHGTLYQVCFNKKVKKKAEANSIKSKHFNVNKECRIHCMNLRHLKFLSRKNFNNGSRRKGRDGGRWGWVTGREVRDKQMGKEEKERKGTMERGRKEKGEEKEREKEKE